MGSEIMIMAACPEALASRGSDLEACHHRPAHRSAQLCGAQGRPWGILPGTSMFTAWPEGYTKSWGLSMWCIMIMAVCPKALVSRGSDEEACHSRPDQASLCLHGGGPDRCE